VTSEIREPSRTELPDYYRALPFANGLPSWEPAPAAWHGGPEPWPPMRTPATPKQLEQWAELDDADASYHPVAAFVGGKVVGASAMLSMEVTIPGGAFLPTAGVTGTGVIATHRRRGLLRQMMQAMVHSALERRETFAMLSASEGSIYGRFGFHVSTHRARWEIARADAQLRPTQADSGSLELVDASTAREHWPAVHATVRATRVGELSPQPGRWDSLTDAASGTDGPLRYLVHRNADGHVDGAANFRLPWSSSVEHVGTLVIEALEATTPQAYRAMWGLLLDFDLTSTIVAPGRPRDEPLRWMLGNPRSMRITRQSDNLWARILDVKQVLEARSYDCPDTVTFTIDDDTMCPANNGTWRLAVEGSDGECSRTDMAADLSIDLAGLSALYLGGMSAHDLAYAGRIRPHVDDALQRVSRMLRSDPEPYNSFGF